MSGAYLESDSRQWLTVALEHGAKIVEYKRAGWLLFRVLDQGDSFLWDAWFNHAEAAARAYCREHGLLWPNTAAPESVQAEARRLIALRPHDGRRVQPESNSYSEPRI